MVSPDKNICTDRVQTYDEIPAPVRPRHALANWTSVKLGDNPNRPTVNEETGEQSQMMMIDDSNRHNMRSEDTESTDGDPIYSDHGSELN